MPACSHDAMYHGLFSNRSLAIAQSYSQGSLGKVVADFPTDRKERNGLSASLWLRVLPLIENRGSVTIARTSGQELKTPSSLFKPDDKLDAHYSIDTLHCYRRSYRPRSFEAPC